MIPLYTEIEFKSAKANTKLPCKCYNCQKVFYVQKKLIKNNAKYSGTKIRFCSHACSHQFMITKQTVTCNNCGNLFNKRVFEINKSENHFCSRSCAVTYHNTHKTTGNRRSKLEAYLEQELSKLHPNLEILFNNKSTINSELDIYIPSLKLAFELNGIFHYEPIHGQGKLNQIQNNDLRKFQACLERGIEFCIIDTSQQKYFKEQTSKKYLNIVINLINSKLLNP